MIIAVVIVAVMVLVLFVTVYVRMKMKTRTKRRGLIIVSFTTSPKRIMHTEHVVESLSNQTVPPDKIVINVPYVFKRNGQTYDSIPDFITKNPLVHVNRCEDIGPATKILPTTQLYDDPETIIISVDDDIEYKRNMIEILLRHSDKHPDAAITGASFMTLGGDKAELIEGYSSVLYKKRFIDDLDVTQYPKVCYLGDDLIISNHLRKKGIEIVVVSGEKPFGDIYLDYGSEADGLKAGADNTSKGNISNYKECAEYLKKTNQLYVRGEL
jgi:hypothetical protein